MQQFCVTKLSYMRPKPGKIKIYVPCILSNSFQAIPYICPFCDVVLKLTVCMYMYEKGEKVWVNHKYTSI